MTGDRIWMARIAIMTMVATTSCHRASSYKNQVEAGWISNQSGISEKDKVFLSGLIKDRTEQSKMLTRISDWRACIARYGDGTSIADRDFDKSDGKLFYAGSGGDTYHEDVPGFPDCEVPNHDRGDGPAHFQLLDQFGAEIEDGMIDIDLSRQCRERASQFAETYNRELVKLDPRSVATCAGSPSQRRKLSIAVNALH